MTMHVAKPPNLDEILEKLGPARILATLDTALDPTALDGTAQAYPHWDKLRHLQPPGDLSSEEWWLRLKFGRRPFLTSLPLLDPQDKPFAYGTPSGVQRLLRYVDQHCSGEIAMAEVVTTDEQARHHYLVNSLMEEAIRSSQLEGATTSRQVAKELLSTGRKPRDRSELMIFNNYRALEFMRDGMGDELTPDLVLTLHRILTEGTLDDPTAAGRPQEPDEERVVVLDIGDGTIIHAPPPAEQLSARLEAMCRFANQPEDAPEGFVHPVVRAILLHFWLAYDHPFADGNGRTARALFYWHMRNHGYWLIEYLSISGILRKAPAQYTRAFLFTETDDGDTTYFILHQLEVIRRAVEDLSAYLRRKTREVQDVEKLLKDAGEFNHRQLALLTDAIRHPSSLYTYHSHATSHRVAEETARSDLVQLLDAGLLQRRKTGHKHVYNSAPNLVNVLKTR
jgi:Fic family protein